MNKENLNRNNSNKSVLNTQNQNLPVNKKMNKSLKIILIILTLIVLSILSLTIYEVLTVNNTYYIGQKNLQIPILVYHDIVADESQIEDDYMQTTVDNFRKQITGLMKLGYKPISYQDLQDYKDGKKAISKWSFLITFDDGYEGVYKYAYELAKEYNIPMTSFVVNSCVGLSPSYYTWDQAKEMHDSGLISIYSHGYTHARYDNETAEKLLADIDNSYVELREKLNDENILKVFTYPYGLYTDYEREVLWNNGYMQNLTDSKINFSNTLDFSGLHRSYPLNDSVFKILLKTQYRAFRYR